MNSTLHRVILVFSGVLLLLILASIAVSINRGFDFQDESFYMLCYSYTNIYKEGISSYHVIVHTLTNWLHPTIVTYRVESLVFTLLSSYALFNGMYKWLQANFPSHAYFSYWFLFIYVFIANSVHYVTGLQTINYNILINTSIISCTGIMLYLFSYDAATVIKSKWRLLLILLIGILCTFSFFIKFSTGILQVMAYAGLIFVYYIRHSFKARIIIIATLLGGCIAGALIYFTFFQSHADWAYNFMAGYREITKPTDHPPGALLQSYMADVTAFLHFTRVNFYWIAILPILLFADGRLRHNKTFAYLRNALIVCCTAYFVYRLYLQNFHRANFIRTWGHRNGYFYPIIMIAMTLLLLVAAYNRRANVLNFLRTRYRLIIVALFLLFTPLLATIGTSNPLFLNLLFNAAPWLCFILLLLFYVAKYTGHAVAGIFLTLTLLFTAGQIIDGNTLAPYYATFRKSKTNIFDQTERATQIPQLNGVYIDTATKNFLYGMQAILQAHKMPPAYPIWSFSSGIAYLMGGVQIEEFWYNKTCTGTKNFHLEGRPPIFILSPDHKQPDPALLACLRAMGINYPEDYEPAGEVWFPHFRTPARVLFPKTYRP